jgi:uncharacterized membrane protein
MTKRMVIAALALVGVFVALYLTLYKVGAIGELSCTVGSCTTVQSSKWATFLGLPVAAWGVGFYLSVLAVTLVGLQDRFIDSRPIALFLVVSSGIGVAFSLWLTYLEAFVIRAWCQWCVVSAIIVVCIFIASLLDLRELSEEPLVNT